MEIKESGAPVEKQIATLIAGVAVLVLTVLPPLVPADQIGWLRWKITLWSTAGVAFIALCLQILWTRQDEREQQERLDRQEQREKKNTELLKHIADEFAQSRNPRKRRAADIAKRLLETDFEPLTKEQMNLLGDFKVTRWVPFRGAQKRRFTTDAAYEPEDARSAAVQLLFEAASLPENEEWS